VHVYSNIKHAHYQSYWGREQGVLHLLRH